MINENKLAQEIAALEGRAENLSIGQIKEVLKITLGLLSDYKASEIMALIEKHS